MAASRQGAPPAPERLRLRSSCHSCASSKLKCPQERPTCSRCAKRGLACEYLVAKQGGRKPNRQSAGSQSRSDRPADARPGVNAYLCLSVQAESAAPPSSNSGIDALGSPGNMHQSSRTSMSMSSNVIQDLFGPLDDISSSASTTTTSQIDSSHYFFTPISYAADMADVDILEAADIYSTGVNSSNNDSEGPFDAFSPFGDTVSELFTVSIPNPTPKISMQPSVEAAESYMGFGANKLPHSCLNRALRSMEQISSVSCHKGASACIIVAQNEAAIEAVGTILTCPCSQDGYLLIIISLVVFKVLDLYAAAARQTPSLQDLHAPGLRPPASTYALPNTGTTVGKYCLEGADSARMAAQLVLGKLHLVRRLVEQLSSPLKKQAAKSGGRAEIGTPENLSLDMDNEWAVSLSAALYDNLALDLANRLKALSLDIINQLKRL